MRPVAIRLEEGLKQQMREASLELAARVLRAADWGDAADLLDEIEAEAVCVRADAPRVLSFVVRTSDVFARSARRAGLRYAARMLRIAGGQHDGAALFLEGVASSNSAAVYEASDGLPVIPSSRPDATPADLAAPASAGHSISFHLSPIQMPASAASSQLPRLPSFDGGLGKLDGDPEEVTMFFHRVLDDEA